jgi:hypothetical protein
MAATTPQGTSKGTAAKAEARRKRLKKIHVTRASNGGFVAKHHYQPEYGGTPAPDSHAFADSDAMYEHLEKTMKEHG